MQNRSDRLINSIRKPRKNILVEEIINIKVSLSFLPTRLYNIHKSNIESLNSWTAQYFKLKFSRKFKKGAIR